MTGGLYPTPTRLRLLREVDAEEIIRRSDDGASVDLDGYRVTAKVAELAAAGWVELDGSVWRLTAAGREVLDAAGPPPPGRAR